MERNECEIKKWRAKNWRLEICKHIVGNWRYSEWRVNLWTEKSLRMKIGE